MPTPQARNPTSTSRPCTRKDSSVSPKCARTVLKLALSASIGASPRSVANAIVNSAKNVKMEIATNDNNANTKPGSDSRSRTALITLSSAPARTTVPKLRGLKNEPTVTGLPSAMSSPPERNPACTKIPKTKDTMDRTSVPTVSRPAEKYAPFSPSTPEVLAVAPPSSTNTRPCTTTPITPNISAARTSGPRFFVNLFHAHAHASPMLNPDPDGGP